LTRICFFESYFVTHVLDVPEDSADGDSQIDSIIDMTIS
jgi:hypothetical protein